jgi:hypothetical protein
MKINIFINQYIQINYIQINKYINSSIHLIVHIKSNYIKWVYHHVEIISLKQVN